MPRSQSAVECLARGSLHSRDGEQSKYSSETLTNLRLRSIFRCFKGADFPGEGGQSLQASGDSTLNQLANTVFKENKHAGIAFQTLQEQRGGSVAAVGVRRA